MVKLLCLFVLLIPAQLATAQCKSGDCNTGKGVYDFGWCVYDGVFKNGKPDGRGTMKYDDYSYTGLFSNGIEDGQGLITYKNGKTESVLYKNGKKEPGPDKVAAADWKPLEPQDPACTSGNCITGFGSYKFPSGNVYTGNWVNRARQGNGKVQFANGDVLEGNFTNNEIVSGTYKFSNGYSFNGTWNSKGDMYDGNYYSPSGSSVRLDRGTVIVPPPRSVIVNGTAEQTCKEWENCSKCSGHGILSKPIVTTYSYTIPGTYSIDRYGNRHTEYESVSNSHTSSIPNYVPCDRCGGKGRVCADKK
ncbi:MAG: hypothetical protein ABI113_02885 [Mucilaginibacter sp.]